MAIVYPRDADGQLELQKCVAAAGGTGEWGAACVISASPPRAHPHPPALRRPLYCPPSADEFFEDYHEVVRMVHHGPIKSFSYRRLQLLEARFNLHMLLNQQRVRPPGRPASPP